MTTNKIRIFLFIDLLSFLLSCLLEIGRHFVVVVIGHREIAGEIDFYAMAFADCHRGQDVEKFIENLRRGLRCARGKSLLHEVAPRGVECPSGARLAYGSKRSERQGHSEDAQIVVVDLVSEPSITDLIEPLELVKADGIAVWHKDAVEGDSQARLAK